MEGTRRREKIESRLQRSGSYQISWIPGAMPQAEVDGAPLALLPRSDMPRTMLLFSVLVDDAPWALSRICE
jgi:hypothetical protein